jgi:hypothetical protein
MLRLDVPGIPAPKGSSRAIARGDRGMLVPSGSDENRARQKDWRTAVSDRAREGVALHRRATGVDPTSAALLPDGAVAVVAVYRFPMRAGDVDKKHGGPREKAPLYLPTGKDADKLQRATLDALTTAGGVWRDDAQVSVSLAVRVYAVPGTWTGAVLLVGSCDRAWEIVATAEELVVTLADQLRAAKDANVILARRRAPRPSVPAT